MSRSPGQSPGLSFPGLSEVPGLGVALGVWDPGPSGTEGRCREHVQVR